MSGTKEAPITSVNSDALAQRSMDDYTWTTQNFGDLFKRIDGGVGNKAIERRVGAAPTIFDARAKLIEEDPKLAAALEKGGMSASWANSQIEQQLAGRFNQMQYWHDQKAAKVEQNLIDRKEQRGFGRAVQQNVSLAGRNMRGARATEQMDTQRLGLAAPNADVAAAKRRVDAFSRVGARAAAANTTRRGLRDFSVQRGQISSGLGSALMQLANQATSTAASTESGRNNYNASQQRGGVMGAITGGLSGAVTGMIATGGNPIGAIVGGGMGAAQGYGG